MPPKRKAKDNQQGSGKKAEVTDVSKSTPTSAPDDKSLENGPLMFDIPFAGKSIACQKLFPQGAKDDPPQLIFTHGAGGGIESPATKSFAEGFAEHGPVVLYQGTMNLQSRTKMFVAVIEHLNWGDVLGGRSMGARAAVMAANQLGRTKSLVLVSYPLTSPAGAVRDQILLDIDKEVEVLFIIGDRDSMCDLDDLRKVREKMKAKTWLIVVEGADHGMSMSKKAQMETGRMAAEWVKKKDEMKTEIRISKNLSAPLSPSSSSEKASTREKHKNSETDEIVEDSDSRKRRRKRRRKN